MATAKYLRKETSVTRIALHFVIVPKYRKPVFDCPDLDLRFKDLATQAAIAQGAEVLAIETDSDHAHILAALPPTLAPADMMKKLKGSTSFHLRQEFPGLRRLPSLWTRSYFCVSVGDRAENAVKAYVESQKDESHQARRIRRDLAASQGEL